MVPLNGAFGRLLCKFSALLLGLLLFAWTIAQCQRSAAEVDELEGRLRFAREQLSSLHAQIDVITRHKEKIESLLEVERERFERINNEKSARIVQVEAENSRLGAALAKLNQTLLNTSATPSNYLMGQSGAIQNAPMPMKMMEKEEKGVLAKPAAAPNDGHHGEEEGEEQKPIGEPAKEEEEEEEKGEDDPFGEGEGGKMDDEGKGGMKMEEEDGGRKEEADEKMEENKRMGEGGGEKKKEKKEEEEKDEADDKQEGKRKAKEEANGAEKMEEGNVFRRPRPRDDLVFEREDEKADGGGEEGGGMEKKLMGRRELMGKLAEEKRRRKEGGGGVEPGPRTALKG